MPQSFCQLYAHLIFSTKNREPMLTEDIRPRVHAYLATIAREMGSGYVVVGGVEDHVHILLDLCKSHPPSKIVEKLKRESSKFVKTLGPKFQNFYWQRGYGMFSVSPTHRETCERYVRSHEEHHRSKSYREELIEFLQRYRIKYDDRYIWD